MVSEEVRKVGEREGVGERDGLLPMVSTRPVNMLAVAKEIREWEWFWSRLRR
jgi:hypothetical protein